MDSLQGRRLRRLEYTCTWSLALLIGAWESFGPPFLYGGQARPQVYGFVLTLLGMPIARTLDFRRRNGELEQ